MGTLRVAVVLALSAVAGCDKIGMTGGEYEGSYRSGWGVALVAQQADEVAFAYPRSRMKCKATGDMLTCDWQSVDTRGKARLVRQQDRSLRGTWGHGASDSDGGPWVFIREEIR